MIVVARINATTTACIILVCISRGLLRRVGAVGRQGVQLSKTMDRPVRARVPNAVVISRQLLACFQASSVYVYYHHG